MVDDILKSYDKIYPIQIDLEGAGFGAVILITINQLRYCERNNLYPIVAYDKSCRNAFFDASKGDELWSQYFEPVMPFSYAHFQKLLAKPDLENSLLKLTSKEALQISEESPDGVYSFPFGKWRSEELGDLDEWYAKQRTKGRETIARYVKPNAHIRKLVDGFYERHFRESFVLGVHVRGTDLHYAPVVSPAEYFPHIDAFLEKQPSLKIFLATDQAQYIKVFEDRYGDRLVYSDCFRSDNEVAPFQRTELTPYQKGEEVLLDILILSKCDFLIKGSSNVGEMALYFNAELECLDLGYRKDKAFGQDYGKGWDNWTNPPAWKLVKKRGLGKIANDASSQSEVQAAVYSVRKALKKTRVQLGLVKRKLKTLSKNPHFIFHWMYEPVDRFLALLGVLRSSITYRKHGKLYGPRRLDHLPYAIQNGFKQDFRMILPRLIHKRRKADGTNSCPEFQIPAICRKYMHYVNNNYKKVWSNEMVEELIQSAKSRENFSCEEYPDSVLQHYQALENLDIKGKKAMVLGSISPWIESILLAYGVESVVTIEFDEIACDHPRIKTIDRTKAPLPAPESFDIICSFSSIEHSGLGRYGDEIDPQGDLKVMNEIQKWLAPDGYAIIGVPISHDNIIMNNAHKLYSRAYLENTLFSEFNILDVVAYPYGTNEGVYEGYDWQNQPVFTLKKKDNG